VEADFAIKTLIERFSGIKKIKVGKENEKDEFNDVCSIGLLIIGRLRWKGVTSR
jgi:hypothetical protein